MFKRIMLFLVVALLVGTFAHAASKATEGTIQKVDKSSITIQVGSDQQTFTYQTGLKVTVNGKRSSEFTMKAGDTVSIVADKNNVAKKIDVRSESSPAAGSSN